MLSAAASCVTPYTSLHLEYPVTIKVGDCLVTKHMFIDVTQNSL